MSQEEPAVKPVHAEVISPDTGIARTQSATIEELSQTEDGLVKLERGLEMMRVLRAASIAATFPHDWVLFKAEDRITGYCQDSGCQRFSDFWGIEIFDLGEFIKSEDPDTKQFSWSVTGSALSKRTGQTVTGITGVRYSYEDFITKRNLNRLQVDAEVRKAARANLHGSIIRELAGMKAVPVEELDQVWAQSQMSKYKTSKLCPKGRGFGTANERAGGTSEKLGDIDQVDVPFCSFCDPPDKLVFRPNGNPPFWGCKNYNKHPKDKMVINHQDLLKQIADKKAAAGTREPGAEG